LLERDDRLGGHTHTVVIETERGPQPLDTGFLVHNRKTYPNLVRLFDELGVETRESDMSFSVSAPDSGFEYSSRGLGGFFARPRNIIRPGHYRLLADIIRFNREAPAVLDVPSAESWTLADYLQDGRYSEPFVEHYLAPMASAIWSASLDDIRRFPAQTLVRFMQNHGMLAVGSHPTWRVVEGGSHTYVPLLADPLDDVLTGVRITSVARLEHGVEVSLEARPPVQADDVVFACHGDQVLPLLADPTPAEREVFARFTTTANVAWLHTDSRMLPATPRARASWNYRLDDSTGEPPAVTYHLNRLQGIPGCTDYCVTLNPRTPIDDAKVIRRIEYRHPCMTLDAIAAQARWGEVSGVNRTHYCGAYWRYGFHEDGLMSAIRVAADLGVNW
jgi:predicted NAD/FAD-binding protein